MDGLKALVKGLEKERNKNKIVSNLQRIGKALITDYVLKVDDIVLEPLWVEAYYHNKTVFNDPFVHNKGQQTKFDVLYFHHKTDDQRNGVDICLSLGDYYLSFLLKYTLVNGVVRSQSALSPLIRRKYREKQRVLLEKNRPTDVVSFTERIGLSADREKDEEKKKRKEFYKGLKLAIVRDFDKEDKTHFKFPRKESLVRSYLDDPGSTLDQTEKAAFCKKALGYYLKAYKNDCPASHHTKK